MSIGIFAGTMQPDGWGMQDTIYICGGEGNLSVVAKKEVIMVDLKDSRVKEVLEGMHEAMQRMLKRGGKPKEEYILENRIMEYLENVFPNI